MCEFALSDTRIYYLGIRLCDWSVPHVPAALLPLAAGWKTDGLQFCSDHGVVGEGGRWEGENNILHLSGLELRSISHTAYSFVDYATE
jgi:hypothetical protein